MIYYMNTDIAKPRDNRTQRLYESKYADTNTKNPARFLNNASIINDKHKYMPKKIINTFNLLKSNNNKIPGRNGKQLNIEHNIGQMDRLLRLKSNAAK